MKVAHITTVHRQNDNRIFYKECISLVSVGYDVSLIVAGGESKSVNGVKIIGFSKAQGGRLKRMLKTSFLDMIKVCKQVDADIYHFHDPELIFTGLYLKLIGKKVIYDIHENVQADILSKPYIKSKILKKILSTSFNILEQFLSNFFDAIITARPDITKKFNHKNIITLRNFPILPDLSQLKDIDIRKEKPSIIFVGGMTNIRGINELIDAFAYLDKYELWLLGPISETKLEDRIEQGCKNVKYFGVVEAYDVFNYINKADIGIITFLYDLNHIETLATKPFEYMACGKPMIMSNFKYWKETFADSAFYVNPAHPKEIAYTIINLLNNKAKMEEMSKLNKKLSKEKYNWEKEKEKLLDLYKRFV